MTQEEKAKAYEEALERAKKFNIDDTYASQGTLIKFIFPQLAESEDERIRKALVWHLKAGEDFISNGVRKEECIAYLEKQKEQKTYKPHNWPADKDNLTQEQKPAEWNEEDKRILKGIIGLIDHDQHYGVGNKEMLDWLKSIRPQPKQVWSEEDKEWLSEVYFAIDHSMYSEDERQAMKKYIDYLRPSWKPSEEQMEALKDAVRLFKETHFEKFHYKIESLYEQLKKLM